MEKGMKHSGIALFLILTVGTPAFSDVLGSANDCNVLRAQRDALEVLGVKQNMKNGPVWAKKNLPDTERYLIRNYITIDGKVRFLCKGVQKQTTAEKQKNAKLKKQKAARRVARRKALRQRHRQVK